MLGTHTTDRRTAGDRAVSELLGAILLFGLVVSVLVLLQANAVPSENERVEFDHNQEVQADLLGLDADVADVAATGRDGAALVDLGTTYPNRFLLANPGPPAGTLSTTPAGFTLYNATATGEAGDFWDGSERAYDSRALTYRPDYNVYASAPTTTLAHGVVTDRFPNGALTQIDEGAFVSGRTISLVALDGRRNVSQVGPLSVDLVPLSTEAATVPVTGDGDPVVVRLVTDRSVAEWTALLEPETVAEGGHVREVRAGPGETVEVVFEPGVTYELELARVGVGSGLTRADAAYLAATDGTDRTVGAGEPAPLTVEVRDAYNAPVSGVDVTFTATNGTLDGGASAVTVTTDEDGRARVSFAADGSGTGAVEASVDGASGTGDPKTVEYRFGLTAADTGQSVGGSINPSGPDAVRLVDSAAQGQNCNTNSQCPVGLTLRNTATNAKTITEFRVNVYAASQPGQAARPAPDSYVLTDATGGPRLAVGADFESVTLPSIAAGSSRTFTLQFYEDEVGGAAFGAVEGDLVVVSVVFDDGTSATYFAAPE